MATSLKTPRIVIYYLFFFGYTLMTCESTSDKNAKQFLESLQNVPVVDAKALDTLINYKTASLVYYYTEADIPLKESFLQAFENSAKYLESYNVAVAVVNCVTDKTVSADCTNEDAGNYVVMYRHGLELIKLEINTMFDVNSIMANCLQLLLLEEVPIVGSQFDRETLEKSLLGKQDLIYFFTRAIGTLEHRIFMEIAYTYQDKYTFAVTTKLETSFGLQHSSDLPSNVKFALWTLHCTKASTKTNDKSLCRNILYRGEFTLSILADYMKRLPEPNLLFLPENGTSSIFQQTNDIPIIIIYTNNDFSKHSADVSTSLAYDVKGFAKIIVVNVDVTEFHKIAVKQGFDGHIPRVAVGFPDGNLTFMEKSNELNLTEIHHFIVKKATILTKPGEEIVNATISSKIGTEGNKRLEVEIQDDEVAKTVVKDGNYETEITYLPAVLKDNFEEVVQNADLKMVLYHLPYDIVSLAFVRDFETAAKILDSTSITKGSLAGVNCFDASDLCARENITTYPVIRIHRCNSPYQMYEGPLDTKSIVKAVSLLKHGFPLALDNKKELDLFIKGEYPASIRHLSPSSVMFFAKNEDKDTWAVFKAASKRLSTFVAMAEVKENLLDLVADKFGKSMPRVVSIHHNDTINPVKILSTVSDVDEVVSFVRQSMVATMPELTVENFPTLRMKNIPFIILFLNESNPLSSQLRSSFSEFASMDEFKDSIFCWIYAQTGTLGMQILTEYTKTIALPSIGVVDHKQAKVFTRHIDSHTNEEIIVWLTKVFSGKEEPSKILEKKKWSPPGPYYDFLSMIDNEEEDQEETNNNKIISGMKVKVEKEDDVRMKLLEKNRDKLDLDGKPTIAKDGNEQNTETMEHDTNSHNHEEL